MTNAFDMTLREFLKFAKDSNSALTQLITRENGEPVVAFILVTGKEECKQILPFIQSVSEEWHKSEEK